MAWGKNAWGRSRRSREDAGPSASQLGGQSQTFHRKRLKVSPSFFIFLFFGWVGSLLLSAGFL